jgi:hypothetical protein
MAKEVVFVLSNCNYDKTKLLYKLSKIVAFLEKRAIKDAESGNHPLCAAEYTELKQDLERHIEKLRAAVEGLSREGKFW